MTATRVAGPGRLRSAADIDAVFAGRRSRAGRLVVVHARPRTIQPSQADTPETRVAVIASRKVGIAVRRNRAKRLLREAARGLPWLPGHDVVLIARRACATAPLDQVDADLATQAGRLGLLDPSAG